MSAQLICRTGKAAGNDAVIDGEITLGASTGNGLRLAVEGVSRVHARVWVEDDTCWIEDKRSTNGTFVNGQRIDKLKLRHLDVVTLARGVDLIFLEKAVDDSAAAAGPGLLEASIEWLDGPEAGSSFELPLGEITIGRDDSCNVPVEEPMVSKVHLRITRNADYLTIQDLGSTNGTKVNGQPMEGVLGVEGRDIVTLGESIKFRVNVRRDPSAGVAVKPADDTLAAGSFDQEWRTRLIWSADELAEIDAIKAKVAGGEQPATEPAAEVAEPAKAPAEKPAAKPSAPEPAAAEPVADPAAAVEAEPAEPAEPHASVAAPTRPADPVDGDKTVAEPAAAEQAPGGVLAAAESAKKAAAPAAGDAAVPDDDTKVPGDTVPAVDGDETVVDPALAGADQAAPSGVMNAANRAKQPEPDQSAIETVVDKTAEAVPVPAAVAAAAEAAGAGGIVLPRLITGIRLRRDDTVLSLNPGRHLVGRGFEARVNLDDGVGVSRRHARIEVTQENVWVEDLDSINGSSVNGEPLIGRTEVNDGDILGFAEVSMHLEVVRSSD